MEFLAGFKTLLIKIAIGLLIMAGCVFAGFHYGDIYRQGLDAKNQNREVAVIVKKNDDSQKVADKVEAAQVVYKDRIVVKYQTINKEVIKYVDKENSNPANVVILPSDWVRLHDAAATAANSDSPTAGSASQSGPTDGRPDDTTAVH